MKTVILANGDAPTPEKLQALKASAELFIVADGGANALYAAGISPDLIIGDLDSIEENARNEMQTKGVDVICDPDQDSTDLELACRLAIQRGASEIRIFGGSGGRLDHMFANLLTLFQIPETIPCTLEDETHIMQLIRQSTELEVEIGQIVSVFPLTQTYGLTYSGLKYLPKNKNTEDDDLAGLPIGWLGVCNIATSRHVAIRFQKGSLLVICCHPSPKPNA